MKLCADNECTGCMACVNACACGGLKIVSDEEGFEHPKTNEMACVNCGLCEKACPVLHPLATVNPEQQVYACWTNDKQLRAESSSGGLFTELSRVILSEKGVVFGVAFDKNLTACHVPATTDGELAALRGSKYVQSRIGTAYQAAQDLLDRGRKVLFSGTPCQIAGLRKFVGKNYEGLFTLDLICHGVPSPMVYEKYKLYMEEKLGEKVRTLKFRDKRNSWVYFNISINQSDNKKDCKYVGTYFEDPYIRGFLRDYFLRPSCYDCKFANLKRLGDITIGDFWGYTGKRKEERNIEELGVSLAIVNTLKGRYLFDAAKDRCAHYPKTMEMALCSNRCLTRSVLEPFGRKVFWKDYQTMPFNDLVNKWMAPEGAPLWQRLSSSCKHTFLLRMLIFFSRLVSRVGGKIFSSFEKID